MPWDAKWDAKWGHNGDTTGISLGYLLGNNGDIIGDINNGMLHHWDTMGSIYLYIFIGYSPSF